MRAEQYMDLWIQQYIIRSYLQLGDGKLIFFNGVTPDISTIIQGRAQCSGVVGQYKTNSVFCCVFLLCFGFSFVLFS